MGFSSVGGQVGWQLRVAGSVGVDGRVREEGKRGAHSPTRGAFHAHSRAGKLIPHDRDPYGCPDGALVPTILPCRERNHTGICPDVCSPEGYGEKGENPPPPGAPLGSTCQNGVMGYLSTAYSPALGRCALALRYRAMAIVTA